MKDAAPHCGLLSRAQCGPQSVDPREKGRMCSSDLLSVTWESQTRQRDCYSLEKQFDCFFAFFFFEMGFLCVALAVLALAL